jgi:hypothetical protein
MTVRFGARITSVLALAALTGPAFADVVKMRPKHHHPIAVASAAPGWQGLSEDFFAGQAPDPGSDNRYFSDTRQPKTESLGAPIFQRWQ